MVCPTLHQSIYVYLFILDAFFDSLQSHYNISENFDGKIQIRTFTVCHAWLELIILIFANRNSVPTQSLCIQTENSTMFHLYCKHFFCLATVQNSFFFTLFSSFFLSLSEAMTLDITWTISILTNLTLHYYIIRKFDAMANNK